jgi:Nucleotidyl transferase AbiEii toxin, Type IV TA system
MSRPTRDTTAGRTYLDLQNRARREGRATQELLTLYALERWLARLVASQHAGKFVLKGGMLLAVLDARRPTADVDLLARQLSNDEDTVVACVLDVASTAIDDDGVEFLPDTVTVRSIRDGDLYSGLRVSMSCRVSAAQVKLKLDINFGDPVTPAPKLIDFPSLRTGYPPVEVLGYPIETVLAEKVTTAISLGEANTRVRDYADVYTLTGRHELAYQPVREALDVTADYRGVTLVPLSEVVGELAALRQDAYRAFRQRLGPDGDHLPAQLADLVVAAAAFVDPLTTGDVGGGVWSPDVRHWT